jgi:hypothetical protein
VEPERGARSAAARKERPSGESGEVLRLHNAAGDLGSHADAEKRNPREAVVTLDRLPPLTPETRLALTVWALSRHRFRITARVRADVRDAPEGESAARTRAKNISVLKGFFEWATLSGRLHGLLERTGAAHPRLGRAAERLPAL